MRKRPNNPERTFGISVGGVLCAVAVLLLWRHLLGRAEAVGSIGVALVVCGLKNPLLLRRPSALWWRFSHALGNINARILLTLLFVIVLVPLSMFWRLIGKDPLARRRERWTGWEPYPVRYRERKHYRRMY